MGESMTFSKLTVRSLFCKAALLAGSLALAACAGGDLDVDNTTGSHLAQPPPGSPPEPTVEAGDIAIAAQEFSHSIRELPQVANATTPPLVRFKGVTSILRDQNGQLAPVDTEPYTSLLRDRLLLGDREKLRFIERQLPPLNTVARHGKHAAEPIEADSADYEVLAELRGRADADYYRVQIEFVDARSRDVLFSAVYRIRREAPDMNQNDMSGGDPGQEQVPIPQSPEVPPAAQVDRESDVPAATSQYQPPPPPQGRDDGN